jgi:hypothetical protein
MAHWKELAIIAVEKNKLDIETSGVPRYSPYGTLRRRIRYRVYCFPAAANLTSRQGGGGLEAKKRAGLAFNFLSRHFALQGLIATEPTESRLRHPKGESANAAGSNRTAADYCWRPSLADQSIHSNGGFHQVDPQRRSGNRRAYLAVECIRPSVRKSKISPRVAQRLFNLV